VTIPIDSQLGRSVGQSLEPGLQRWRQAKLPPGAKQQGPSAHIPPGRRTSQTSFDSQSSGLWQQPSGMQIEPPPHHTDWQLAPVPHSASLAQVRVQKLIASGSKWSVVQVAAGSSPCPG
jgi:hypothetical protein